MTTTRQAGEARVVPAEPTHAMLTAVSDGISAAQKQGWFGLSPIDIWRTMLAAAPTSDLEQVIQERDGLREENKRLATLLARDVLAFKMIDVGQTAVPDHWRFRCDARKIAQDRLKALSTMEANTEEVGA